jgi:peptidoglycan/LPS O-acetylase OafA/YrhL
MSVLARPTPSGGRPLPQLDALRGVAILCVFAQHLGDRFLPVVEATIERAAPPAVAPWLLTAVHHAWWGVDLFFVLSGFSLALGPLRSPGLDTASSFLLRRAARVLPAFYVALLVHIAANRHVVALPGFAGAVAAHLAVLQGYVSPGGVVLIGAAWSLTTEAHFYLLFPALARLVVAPPRWLRGAAVCGSVWLARAVLHEAFLESGVLSGLLEASQRRWIVSRLDQFVLGCLAAGAHVAIERSRFAEPAARFAPAALALAAALLLVAFRLEGALYLLPWGSWPYLLLSLSTAALVLAAVLLRGRAVRLVTPRPLCALGVVSYGVFLYHQLALGLADPRTVPQPSWPDLAQTAAVALALSVAAGALSWVLIERPAIRWAAARARAGVRGGASEEQRAPKLLQDSGAGPGSRPVSPSCPAASRDR